jgi:hypothetical protein
MKVRLLEGADLDRFGSDQGAIRVHAESDEAFRKVLLERVTTQGLRTVKSGLLKLAVYQEVERAKSKGWTEERVEQARVAVALQALGRVMSREEITDATSDLKTILQARKTEGKWRDQE